MEREKITASHPFQESDKENPEIRSVRERMEREAAKKIFEATVRALLEQGILTDEDIDNALAKARESEERGGMRPGMSRRNDH